MSTKAGQAHNARSFAQMVAQGQLDVRLVFLNACESGRASAEVDPARSSIAAALLDRGVPAVIATQFSMPDTSAHYLAAMIYNGLAGGKGLVDALTTGRRAMQVVKDAKFFDWGIPVLYASEPWLQIFPAAPQTPGVKAFSQSLEGDTGLLRVVGATEGPAAPSLKVNRTKSAASPKVRAALVDLDVKAGFMPDLVDKANARQSYFSFELAFLPLPAGSVMTKIGDEQVAPQLFVPRIQEHFKNTPSLLQVDRVVCITACMVAWEDPSGKIAYNYFTSSLPTNPNVVVVSTTDLREYATEAGIEFPKALLRLALAELIISDERWPIGYHERTYGCLFDFCEERQDVVKGLRSKSFDHKPCRRLIKDAELLASIDALMAL